jgi:hypothetical protein
VQAGILSGITGGEMDQSQFKVRFAWKAAAFVLTVLTLSWFFEGTREIKDGLTVMHVGMLALGTVSTLLMLGVQGYWIYFEEKHKGTLKKRIDLFERIHAALEKSRGTGSGEEK